MRQDAPRQAGTDGPRTSPPAGGGLTLVRVVRSTLPPARGFLPLVVLLLAWELVATLRPSPYFPPPSAWWEALRLWYWDGLAANVGATLRTVLVGLLLATALGSAVGLLVSVAPTVRRSLNPLLEFLRTLPAPTIVPIALLFLGPGESMKLFAVVFAALWPILLNTAAAAGQLHRTLVDVAQVFRLSRFEHVRKVVFPTVVPYILIGVRVAIPVALIVTILTEMLVSTPGVGRDLMHAQRSFRNASAFGLLFVVGVLGYLINALFAILQGMVLRRWPQQSEETSAL